MEHWYVYYKVPQGETDAVAGRVRAMLARLGESGPRGRLMRRPGADDGQVTLMEVYEPVANAETFAQALDAAVRTSGLAPELIERRHVERFEDL